MPEIAARRAAAPLVLLLLTTLFYWKLTLTRQYSWLDVPAVAARALPWLDWQARELHAGRLPLWDPLAGYGRAVLDAGPPGVANPLHLLLLAPPLRNGRIRPVVWHGFWMTLHWLGACFAWSLARALGAGPTASVIGAAGFALSGVMGSAESPERLCAVLWIPLVLRCALAGNGAAAGAAVGLAALSGEWMTAACAALGAIALAGARWRFGAVMAAVAAVVGAAGWRTAAPGAGFTAAEWFTGPVLAALAVAGGVAGWRQREVRVLAAIAVVAGLASVAVAQAALAALAALGVDGWAGLRSRDAWWRSLTAVGAAVMAVYLVVALAGAARDARPAMWALGALLAAGVLYARSQAAVSRRTLEVCLAGLVLLEAGTVAGFSLPQAGPPGSVRAQMRQDAELGEWMTREAGWFRVRVNPRDVPYDFGHWFGVEICESCRARFWLARTAPRKELVAAYESPSGVKAFVDRAAPSPMWTLHAAAACPQADRLRVESRTAAFIAVQTSMACPGTLVLAAHTAPGWGVWVDRVSRPQEPAGGWLAVYLDAGTHRVEFRYRPWGVYGRLAASAGGLLAAVWLARALRRESLRETP